MYRKVKRRREGVEREKERELVQMNNLLKFPGIVCQGDDGRLVREPKQTVSERGSLLSGVSERESECVCE